MQEQIKREKREKGITSVDEMMEAFNEIDAEKQRGGNGRKPESAAEVLGVTRELKAAGIPILPDSALLDPSLGENACPWLDEYVEWSERWSPRSFEGYHEAIGLALLSTVAARRVKTHFGKERFTNLYILLVGRTTIWAKTTALSNGRALLSRAGLDFLLAPDESTPQAFLRRLASKDLPANYDHLDEEMQTEARMRIGFGAQRGWFYEEFGSGIEAMLRKDGTMADFRKYLRAFDDCPYRYSRETISRGIEVVDKPYLTLIGNITPADLRPVAGAGSQLWGDGFLARFAFITPPQDAIRDGRFPRGERTPPLSLVDPLADWHKRLSIPQVEIVEEFENDEPTGERWAKVGPLPQETLTWTEESYDAHYRYDEALRQAILESRGNTDLDGNRGRFSEKALRIAALFASLAGSKVIDLPHLAKAQQIVERWRLYAQRAYDQAATTDDGEIRQLRAKMYGVLKKHQGSEKYSDGMTAAQVGRYIRGEGREDLEPILYEMEDEHAVAKHETSRAVKFYIPGVNGLG
jgi:hypothetical protein